MLTRTLSWTARCLLATYIILSLAAHHGPELACFAIGPKHAVYTHVPRRRLGFRRIYKVLFRAIPSPFQELGWPW